MYSDNSRGMLEQKIQELQRSIAELRDLNRRLEEKNQQFSRANQHLASANKSLQAMLGQLQIGIILTRASGHVTFINQTAKRALNRHQPAGNRAQTWEELFPIDGEGRERLKEAYLFPSGRRLQIHWRAPNGRTCWAEIEIKRDSENPEARTILLHDFAEDADDQASGGTVFQGLCVQSEQMQLICHEIRKLACVDASVLIEGETGTGKELVARAIHYSGPRRENPFLAINCAGLTESLLASQLFGHKRGSFTGAVADQVGLFEAAHGGTLFLDEVGDIPLSLQTTLLRVLEEMEITRIGETKPRKVDVRIIAATHCDLSEQLADGTFRQDLFYRIRVARIRIPPLRERLEDIPTLVTWFLRHAHGLAHLPFFDVSPAAMEILLRYHWPGNVRELKNVIASSSIHAKGPMIEPEDLPREIQASANVLRRGKQMDKSRILDALNQVSGNRTAAARLLGISRATLYRAFKKLKIDAENK